MRFSKDFTRMMLIGIALIAVAGCSKAKTADQTTTETTTPAAVEFKVTGVDVGKGLDSEKRLAMVTSDFAPMDTIFVSVATEGTTSAATLGAKWTFGPDAQLVNEMTESIAPTGPAHTEFHISKPDGFPVGSYKVDITLDGASVGTKDFQVK